MPPTIRRTGPFLYLRLRRHDYTRRGPGGLGRATRAVPVGRRRRLRLLPPRRGRARGRSSRSALQAALDGLGRRRGRPVRRGRPRPVRTSRGARVARRCHGTVGTEAATKISDPGTTGRVSSPTVIMPRPGDDVVQLVLRVGRLRVRRARLERCRSRPTGPAPAGTRGTGVPVTARAASISREFPGVHLAPFSGVRMCLPSGPRPVSSSSSAAARSRSAVGVEGKQAGRSRPRPGARVWAREGHDLARRDPAAARRDRVRRPAGRRSARRGASSRSGASLAGRGAIDRRPQHEARQFARRPPGRARPVGVRTMPRDPEREPVTWLERRRRRGSGPAITAIDEVATGQTDEDRPGDRSATQWPGRT